MPEPVQSPTTARHRLADMLRRAREAADLTQEQVAEMMDWSVSKLIRVESARVSLSRNDTRALADLYHLTEDEIRASMLELSKRSRARAWWNSYSEEFPSAFVAYLGLEADATDLRYFQPVHLPGILQTAGYARAVLPAGGPALLDEEQIARRVSMRLTRQQQVLERPDPPQVRVCLDEAVLHHAVGGAQTMRDQMEYLTKVALMPHVLLRVMPFDAGPRLSGPFTVLSSPPAEGAVTEIVYAEGAMLSDLITAPARVTVYRHTFDFLWRRALPEDRSTALIEQVAAGR